MHGWLTGRRKTVFQKLTISFAALLLVWTVSVTAQDAASTDSLLLAADETASQNEFRSLDENVQDLKKRGTRSKS